MEYNLYFIYKRVDIATNFMNSDYFLMQNLHKSDFYFFVSKISYPRNSTYN